MKITGYTSALSVRPGERLRVYVSTEVPTFSARLVRLRHGIVDPSGPGFKYTDVPSHIDGEYRGLNQPIEIGSYAIIGPVDPLADLNEFTLGFWIWPTKSAQKPQVIISQAGGLSIELLGGSRLALRLQDSHVATLDTPLMLREWYFVSLRRDRTGVVSFESYAPGGWPVERRLVRARAHVSEAMWTDASPLVFAARRHTDKVGDFFNGKLENPWILARALTDVEIADVAKDLDQKVVAGALAHWDFARDASGDNLVDRHHRMPGTLINMPTRAVTGHSWTGDEHDFRAAPDQYGAIHFHEDDLDDVRWKETFGFNVPATTPSGIYAIHLKSSLGEDFLPFAVTPPKGEASAKVVFVMPTLTYLAYGNEAIANRPDMQAMLENVGIKGQASYPSQEEDKYIVAHKLMSCYDIHSDGSGVCYASRLRPLLNMRPTYRMPLHGLMVRPGGSPHHFPVDLCITDWLEAHSIAYDVVTDDELDLEGRDLLARYKVVITGCHPEYSTAAMLDSLRSYCEGGGRLIYLGGNGFFCVTSLTLSRHVIETRRSRTTRAWTSRPGEERHSTSGEVGGPWRYRGQRTNRILGVSTSCVGFTTGRAYRQTPQSREDAYKWAFEGIKDDAIGACPNLIYGNGAVGFEVDRADHDYESPERIVVLASARLDDDSYQEIIDEIEAAGPVSNGSTNPKVRADMTYLPYPNGGGVFSMSSVLWAGALSHNGYDNSASRLSLNVLRHFLR